MNNRAAAGLVILSLTAMVPAHGQAPAPCVETTTTICPFADNDSQIPPNYNGPLFKLSRDYPTKVAPASEFPWREAIHNGPITVANANAYVLALKAHVAHDMRLMLTDSPQWDPVTLKWYNEPWTGYLREATHGMYVGSSPFASQLFIGSGLQKSFTTYVLTFYDEHAGNALYNVWGLTDASANKPNIVTAAPQFAEGAIVVKAAFSTANADVWPVMRGALRWDLYMATNATTGLGPPPPIPPLPATSKHEMHPASFFQFDIVVKDTISAPKTGWVFSTLVYDKNAPGADFWDKMVPLGAQWGNDPEVNSAASSQQALTENWINPAAPAYSKMTLGWGGRLSGPNDGAVNDAVVDSAIPSVAPFPIVSPQLPSSSCMSCHSVAEWPMQSFLLPTATDPQEFAPPGFVNSDYLIMWPPGSAGTDGTSQWMHWFQDRLGTVPADSGSVAFDFDMVFCFKSLNGMTLAHSLQPGGPSALTAVRAARRAFPLIGETYNGRVFNSGRVFNGR